MNKTLFLPACTDKQYKQALHKCLHQINDLKGEVVQVSHSMMVVKGITKYSCIVIYKDAK
jgi:hypothetical protein